MRHGALFGAVLAVLARPAAAQNVVPVDRIVAVVGDRPILSSDVEERLLAAQTGGEKVPTDSAGRMTFRRALLLRMVNEELEVQQAEHDTTIKVTEQEVQDQVEQTVKRVHSQVPDANEFQRQLHLAGFGTVEEWRRKLAEDQRRQTLQQRLLESLRQSDKLKPIPPTDAQMRDYWETHKADLPKRPANVSFRQIVIVPVPDSASLATARALADSLLTALRAGADFATLAHRFSADSASAAQGGELGWFRRGVMVKPFEDAAFRLRPGDLSPVVATQFGFHIIQVERVQPAELLARHILIAPVVTPAQVTLARHLADSVLAAWKSGSSFDSLARFSDPDEPKLAENVQPSALPSEYQQLFTQDSTLGLKPVLVLGAGTAKPRFAVVDVTARQAEGEVVFGDVKDQVRTFLSQQLAEEHYVSQLRRATYVDIRY